MKLPSPPPPFARWPRAPQRGALAIVAGALALLFARESLATPSLEAEVLYQEGVRLLNAGQAHKACPKLAESQRIDPALGTEFHLAGCHEALGQYATAWGLFIDVANRAMLVAKPEQEQKARQRAAALEPRLTKMLLILPEAVASLPDVTIKRNGQPLGRALWGTAIPLDPGTYVIRVEAPHKKPWEIRQELGKPGTVVEIRIPPLEEAPPQETTAPPALSPPPAPLPSRKTSPGLPPRSTVAQGTSSQRTLALGLGGFGLVSLGVGSVFGLMALDKNSTWQKTTQDNCDAELRCDEKARGAIKDLERDRATLSLISTLGIAVGGASLLGATLLWVAAPTPKTTTTHASGHLKLVPLLGPFGGGARLDARF